MSGDGTVVCETVIEVITAQDPRQKLCQGQDDFVAGQVISSPVELS